MTNVIVGHRVGKSGKLAIGCSGAIFDKSGRILLVKRADNGRWAVPGGYMEPGESVAAACSREVWEETGLHVQADHLIAIYSTPHKLLVYPDGNKWQLVILHFRTTVLDGVPTPSDETTAVRYFTQSEIKHLDIGELDTQRIGDSFSYTLATFIR